MNLKTKPFYLDDEAVAWVQDTLASLSTDEKIGQLFLPIGLSTESDYLDHLLSFHIGGLFFRSGKAKEVQATYEYAQKHSKIPLLTAANLEDGGNGAAEEATAYGSQMAVASTADTKDAYTLGKIASTDGKAVGVNWGFSPVVDLDLNFRNPITNIRTYGSSVQQVIDNAKEYVQAFHDNNMMTSIKHFPGDGVDERDQHLLTSINSLPMDAWRKNFGKIYKELIEIGSKSVMVGHIALPAYSGDDTPATLSPKILQNLLREELGFNGLTITDASPMVGFCSAMERRKAVPYTIQAGCDMLLFNRVLEEDIQFMKDGLKDGILTKERLDEAVTRILAAKASLGLHKSVIFGDARFDDYSQEQEDLADRSITLVKVEEGLLPISPQNHKRVLVQILGNFDSNNRVSVKIKCELEKRDFEVSLYEPELNFLDLGTVQNFTAKYDLVLYVANIENASNQTVSRIHWHTLFGLGNNLPWFAKEIPTILLSIGNPYHIFDLPMVGTVVNAYCNYDHFIKASIEKLVGESEFKGVSPVNPFCENKILKELKYGDS
ncbi:glycoside hydrolase family 3 protein [uncultured Streptococcus sp.]|uniref:glycoside hydrolase family 3 protein n=1 Tax=uncultured Streptococcus sp. TaxID=83427 RepID=UPI002622A3E1|nr:glycoside hydrolase family 3 N-terminal domain-containing protein [uncultured Streptococcus sp.]